MSVIIPVDNTHLNTIEGNSPSVFITPTKSPKLFDYGGLSEVDSRRLASLQIPIDVFEFFREQFVGHPFDFNLNSGHGFREQTQGSLNSGLLIRHLAGEILVGTRCRRDPITGHQITRWYCFDIDAGEEQESVYRLMRKAFSTTPVVVQSSASGGLHCYTHFDKDVALFELFNPYTRNGLIPRILDSVNLRLESGRLELYPQPHGKGFHGNALRLPFGQHSVRLWDDELIPAAASPQDSLRETAYRYWDGYTETISIEELREHANQLPRKKQKRPTKVATRAYATHRTSSVSELYAKGLTRNGQFHTAVYQLSQNYALQGVAIEDAREDLLQWIDEHHNNKSTTYCRSRDAAGAEAVATLESVYGNFEHRVLWAPIPPLTEREFARIRFLTPSDEELVDANGRSHSAAKFQTFVSRVVRGMKQWVVTRAYRDAQTLLLEVPQSDLASFDFMNRFAEIARPWWPRANEPFFVVENPYQFRRTIPGVSESTLHFFWRLTREMRFMKCVRHASATNGSCEAFEVELDFSGATVQSLGQALMQVLPASEIRDRYSNHYAKELLRDGAADLASEWRLNSRRELNVFVSSRLAGGCSHCALSRVAGDV